MNFSSDFVESFASKLSAASGSNIKQHAFALLSGLRSLEEALPESVLGLSKRATPFLKNRVATFLTAYEHSCSVADFVPRAFFFDTEAGDPPGSGAIRATRACGQFRPIYASLVYDMQEFFSLLEVPSAAAAWVTFLPALLVGDDSDFSVAFGYCRTAHGEEGAFLIYAGLVKWLSIEGASLSDAVSGAMVFSGLSLQALLHKRKHKDLCALTRRRLQDPGVYGASASLSASEAELVVERLWGEDSPLNLALNQYLEDLSQTFLDETSSAMHALDLGAKLMTKRIESEQEKSKKEALKAQKRLENEKERLAMAYQGLKARAQRQDQELLALRKRARLTAPTPGAAPVEPSKSDFLTALRASFCDPGPQL